MNLSAGKHLSWIVPVLLLPALSPAAFAIANACGGQGGWSTVSFDVLTDPRNSRSFGSVPATAVFSIWDGYSSNTGWISSPFAQINGLTGGKQVD